MLILSNRESAQHESERARHPSVCLGDQEHFWMGLVAEPSAKLCTNSLCLWADIWVGDRGCTSCSGAAAEERAMYPVVMEGHRESLWSSVKGWNSKEDFSSLTLGAWEPALTPHHIPQALPKKENNRTLSWHSTYEVTARALAVKSLCDAEGITSTIPLLSDSGAQHRGCCAAAARVWFPLVLIGTTDRSSSQEAKKPPVLMSAFAEYRTALSQSQQL